jgi:hypothetical protein
VLACADAPPTALKFGRKRLKAADGGIVAARSGGNPDRALSYVAAVNVADDRQFLETRMGSAGVFGAVRHRW